ncbi:MAG: hypothetical protein H0U27_06750 [Nitrosopumilus sp.]|nr:hypothetical protein [Nitrosopumilus sp.]
MQGVQGNVDNFAKKKLKFEDDSSFNGTVTNRDSFQAKKVEIEFTDENLSSQDIFASNNKSLVLSNYLQQSKYDGDELMSNKALKAPYSLSKFTPSERSQQPKVMSAYEKLYPSENREIKNEIYGIKTTLFCMGEGSAMKAYDVIADRQLWSGIENSNILVKLYKFDLLKGKGKVSSSDVKKVSGMMDTAIKSYKKANDLSIPQAIIYNVETATSDCFLIVEKIQGKLDITSFEQKEQVKKLFKAYFEKNIVLDLGPANLCVKIDESTNSKTVVLVDYMETDKDHKRNGFFEDILRRWYETIYKVSLDLSSDTRKNNAITLIKELTEGLEIYGFDPMNCSFFK